VTLSVAVFKAATCVKSMYMTKPEKKIKYENQRNFYINFNIIDYLGMEFTVCWSELMPEGALISFTVC